MGQAVRLDDNLLEFFKRPLMCIIAGVDPAGLPSAGRGVGLRLLEKEEAIEIIFSAWQWPRLEANIRQTARIAATFVSPSDYVSFQLKGRGIMRDVEATDLDRADLFIAAATNELESLGVSRHLIAPWLTAREARVIQLEVSETYVQTPGPLAGMRAGARSP
ncbi:MULTISPECIES: pyridoxamine 5'-phosphate oxidase family protein [unclassified Chelatococcus]|uniref:pyridoxamine 5'-phosphate oxidase family protein n=1 Tax=unclassified Chelatococcus TaxID=2638111 RepID=UPI001BCD7015|nr:MULTISPECIES: pyridoxamine 5'-phosphate oxidase family protein [unclassified Chelatococcus]MBS7700573.1 pyridoxamine 5'-phosphate oxidase family protein [Chelatococcus sp. YT9]MBX3558688.1 pyridoxamine 5'-phosphate oxidase family protein [Chelatococcus sp.]